MFKGGQYSPLFFPIRCGVLRGGANGPVGDRDRVGQVKRKRAAMSTSVTATTEQRHAQLCIIGPLVVAKVGVLSGT